MPPKRKLTEPAPATRKAAPKRARKVAAASAEALELLAPRGGLSVPDAPGEEKRLARFRTSAPQATKERIERVLSQRFFNVDRQKISSLCEQFKVLGSTGNVYTVQIRNVSHCNCPDRNALCKHILFVLLKILKVPPTSPLVYQAALLDDELAVIFENAPQNAQDRVSAQLAQAYQNALAPSSSSKVVEHVEKRIPTGEDDSCPICYEELAAGQTAGLLFCVGVGGCGNLIHTECFALWAKQATPVTCVCCRIPWASTGASPAKRSLTSPYLNLANEAGISPLRNTTSYYTGPVRGGWRGDGYYDNF